MRRPHRNEGSAGFTLIELMIALLVGGLVATGAFTLAAEQMRNYRTLDETSQAAAAGRVVFDALQSDVQNVGMGTSFYVAAQADALGGGVTVLDGLGASRGVPVMRVVDEASGTDILPGSDALFLLRLEGQFTFIADATSGGAPVDARPVGAFGVVDQSRLQACATQGLLVVVSDVSSAWEPSSMLLPLATISSPTAPGAAGPISFTNAFDIDPAETTRLTDTAIPTNALAIGSIVQCVRPVTYWVDSQRRLRMFASSAASPGGSATLSGTFGSAPIDPANDAVLAEGIEDLQISALMSSASPTLANGWAFAGNGGLASLDEMAEIRVLRMSVLVRTNRADDNDRAPTVPSTIENHSNVLDRKRSYKLIRFEVPIRNLRLFDLMSAPERTTAMMWSYPQ
ncbi:MAG: prepilin-type N-terminal cleavage/methylation domain-containing protein [Deltaproteobacteria bacterium]|nr:prepilin-type N-terminal cleavage/methylation domain-containing protein [Deltaproteobacteria bacterium]